MTRKRFIAPIESDKKNSEDKVKYLDAMNLNE